MLSGLLVITHTFLQAQGLVINGGKVVVGNDSFLAITGNNANLVNNTAAGTDGSIDNNGTIVLHGNLNNNAANNVFINRNGIGEVLFSGSIGQSVLGPSLTRFEKFTVQNSAGLTLLHPVITDALVLTSGPLNLNTNTLTITNSSPSAVNRTGGYVVSERTDNLARIVWTIGATAGAHVFPFGTASGTYIPFVMDVTAGNLGNVSVATYSTDADNKPYPVTPNAVTNMTGRDGNDNSFNTVDRFWQIEKDGPSGTATLTFTASPAEIGTISMLQAQRWNAAQEIWEYPLPNQTNNAISATVPNVSAFSPWTLSGNSQPLPVTLLKFTAAINNSWVDVNWNTASEINNDFFTVEKTRDLVHYETVAIVKGAGNSNQMVQYAVQDKKPYSGISYYRLKQTDFNKKESYSQLVAVTTTESKTLDIIAYPNPTEGDINVSINGAEGKEFLVTLSDVLGRNFFRKKLQPDANTYTYQIVNNRLFMAGVYVLTVSGNGAFFSKKIIVR